MWPGFSAPCIVRNNGPNRSAVRAFSRCGFELTNLGGEARLAGDFRDLHFVSRSCAHDENGDPAAQYRLPKILRMDRGPAERNFFATCGDRANSGCLVFRKIEPTEH